MDAITLPWMDIARKELGQSEINGSKHNPRIIEYHKATSLKSNSDEVAWCSSFVSWVLGKAGYKNTGSAWARSYLGYGTKLESPKEGCIVVFSRGSDSGHVGFYLSHNLLTVSVLGGNQDNKVCIKNYPRWRVLGYRWPKASDVPTPVQKLPEVPANTGFKADWDHLPVGKTWTGYLLEALETHGQKLLTMGSAKDSNTWCWNFATLNREQRKQFFVMLISSMAHQESSFETNQSYKEGFKDAKGSAVISRGLLQISQESANQSAYKGNIKNAADLYDPRVNLETAVKILNYWIPKDGYIASAKLGGARYWSVLRDHSNSKPKIKAKVYAYAQGLV